MARGASANRGGADRGRLSVERLAASLAAFAIVGLVGYLLIRNQPIADPRLFFALRVILSLCAAVLGGAVPGSLNVKWSGAGLAVRAGGALALFIITYTFTPKLGGAENGDHSVTINAPGGVAARDISGGPITIINAPSSEAAQK